MNDNPEKPYAFFGGLYAWIVTIYFGAVMLDIVYSNLVPDAAAAFSEVSDFLLYLGVLTILVAIAAIAFSWRSSTARNLFIASLVVLLFEFFVPAFFSSFLQEMQGLGLTTSLRLAINGLASILALLGLNKLYRQSR